jgi:hypothetical protein
MREQRGDRLQALGPEPLDDVERVPEIVLVHPSTPSEIGLLPGHVSGAIITHDYDRVGHSAAASIMTVPYYNSYYSGLNAYRDNGCKLKGWLLRQDLNL